MKRFVTLTIAAVCSIAVSCTSVNNKVFIKDKAAMQQSLRIAVMPFTDVNGAQGQGTGEAISEALTNEIVKISNWNVVERSQLQKIMKEKELNMTGMTDADAAALGRLAKTDYIIIGSVSDFEYSRGIKNAFVPKTKLAFKARIINTENGSIIGTVSYNKETGKYAWGFCCLGGGCIGIYYIPMMLFVEENKYEELERSAEDVVYQINANVEKERGCMN